MEGFNKRKGTIFKGKVIKDGDWSFEGETIAMWKQMANCIRKVATEVLGGSKGEIHYNKEAWWWSIEVQEVV